MTQAAVADRAAIVARELSLPPAAVARTLELLDGGATVPFVARYRKEATGGLDDGAIQRIHDHAARVDAREARRATILESLREQGVLTPELERAIGAAATATELEDLYLPFKPRRRTRAQAARERGLGPLADLILGQAPGGQVPGRDALGARYVDAARGLPDLDAVFQGARDIVAEQVAERADVRAEVRRLYEARGELTVDAARGKSAAPELAHYRDHVGRRERALKAPSHRVLAAERGEAEGVLRVRIAVPDAEVAGAVRARVVRKGSAPVLARELDLALADAQERLLLPSLENEFRRELKERADAEAIRVFAQNLEALLLAAPLGSAPVLAIDPGLRTGCKVAALSAEGEVRAVATVYPHTGQERAAAATLAELIRAHAPAAIAIGNGTAGRETETFVRKLVGPSGAIKVVMVSEAGASVYSASELARDELPELDVSVRGAVSIGRRLQDPLAELVKIDPKSIGVGQYQHDVDQAALAAALDRVVERAVNMVGVNLNTASPTLLRYVAGLGAALARAIVAHRASHGPFRSRAALQEVPRLGQKAFEQCAGFLRVQHGSEPLDASAVHPERYGIVARMAKDLGVARGELVGNAALAQRIDVPSYVDEQAGVGVPTLRDIVQELAKPGRDPRAEFREAGFDAGVTELVHVKEGMTLNGIVTNVAAFGAFVDVGVHQDGLVHVSELAHRFVKDPAEVVKVGDRVRVKVLSVDLGRRRMALSIKALQASPPGAARPGPSPERESFNSPRRR
ncbi:MAG TPA: Tex-like N-terminal domain-containing protein [Anaeromyxobacteraceae bacterium]|nr:Tex-like N-terminal domain-containing protein [Anaeromyxobacteraceae bacterium]